MPIIDLRNEKTKKIEAIIEAINSKLDEETIKYYHEKYTKEEMIESTNKLKEWIKDVDKNAKFGKRFYGLYCRWLHKFEEIIKRYPQ